MEKITTKKEIRFKTQPEMTSSEAIRLRHAQMYPPTSEKSIRDTYRKEMIEPALTSEVINKAYTTIDIEISEEDLVHIGKKYSLFTSNYIRKKILDCSMNKDTIFTISFHCMIRFFDKEFNRYFWMGYDGMVKTFSVYVKTVSNISELTPNELLYILTRL